MSAIDSFGRTPSSLGDGATPPPSAPPPMPWRAMALGTVVGAGLGGVIGWRTGRLGVGAAVGAAGGALLGHAFDNAAARIQ